MHKLSSEVREKKAIERGRKMLQNYLITDELGRINYLAVDEVSPISEILQDKKECNSNYLKCNSKSFNTFKSSLHNLNFDFPPGDNLLERLFRVRYNGSCATIACKKNNIAAALLQKFKWLRLRGE